jgi:hypothetical protein
MRKEGGIWNSLGSYIYVEKFLKGYLIPYFIFYCFVSEVVIFLKEVYLKHQKTIFFLSSDAFVIPVFTHLF